jgi:hypothetical protein
MSIQQVSDTHCWALPVGDEDDKLHFATADAAAAYVIGSEHTGPDPAELPVPCWTASCDGDGCLEVEGNEDGDRIHILALTLRHAVTDLHSLERVDGRLLCLECADKVKRPAPVGHRPPIFTEHDLSRVFVAASMYADLLPGVRFDEETEDVLKTVQALVVKNLAGRFGRQTARVMPFAIQSPLPGMPSLPAAVVEGSVR